MNAALFAALSIAAVAANAASAKALEPSEQLIGLINDYRRDTQTCKGEPTAATGPLAPVAALAKVDAQSNAALQRSLTRQGYQAAQVQLLSITGPSSANEAMRLLKQGFCQALSNPDHAEIGVARDGKHWRIVMAKPLLSPTLRNSEAAGREIVRLSNLARAQPRRCGETQFAAVPAVSWEPSLASVALAHSRDMATKNYFAHRAPDGSQVKDRARRAGYAWRAVGENIATGQGSAESAMAAWLASPSHCENIMNSAYSAMGAAYVVNTGSDTVIYWTQVLARPRGGAAAAAGR